MRTAGIGLMIAAMLFFCALTDFVLHEDARMAADHEVVNRLLHQTARNQAQTFPLVNSVLIQTSGTLSNLRRETEKAAQYHEAGLKLIAGLEESRLRLTADASKVLESLDGAATTATTEAQTALRATIPLMDALRGNLSALSEIEASVGKVVPSLQASADNFAKASGELVLTGQNVTATTGSLKEVAATADVATRELRTAQGKLKAVAKFIAGLFKVNIP